MGTLTSETSEAHAEVCAWEGEATVEGATRGGGGSAGDHAHNTAGADVNNTCSILQVLCNTLDCVAFGVHCPKGPNARWWELRLKFVQDATAKTANFCFITSAQDDAAKTHCFSPLFRSSWNGGQAVEPALIRAVDAGHVACVELLIDFGADVNLGKYSPGADLPERNALVIASSQGDTKIVQVLIRAGANVNATGEDRTTALYAAARNGHVDSVRLLLEGGADVDKAGKDRFTPVMRAASAGHVECLQLLLSHGANPSPKHSALIPTALAMAAQQGHFHCVTALLEAGAEVNQEWDKKTALTVAVVAEEHACVEALLNCGANVNHVTRSGRTALTVALRRGDLQSTQLLLKAGANVNSINTENLTGVLTEAASSRRNTLACIRAILIAGCPVNLHNDMSHNALETHIYKFNGTGANLEVCRVLMGAGETLPVGFGYGFPGHYARGSLPMGVSVRVVVNDLLQEEWDMRLQYQCRRAIRNHLTTMSNLNLFHRVGRLPLPEKIKEFLLYHATLE